MNNEQIFITECPRDAMQGLEKFVPTELKAKYINALIVAGFKTIDFGSFVSPKAIPQMRDTADVLKKLNLDSGSSRLLAIVANVRGAGDACAFDEISFLGYPFSISETFQQRNTNSSIEKSLDTVQLMQEICVANNKELVVYISMGFGNPYGDPWSAEIVMKHVSELAGMGINIIALADTVGVSNPENISGLFSNLIPEFPTLKIGAHLHSASHNWKEKIEAAYESGCVNFDSALKGFGGCPMAADDLVGNIATENLLGFFDEKEIATGINRAALDTAMSIASEIFEN